MNKDDMKIAMSSPTGFGVTLMKFLSNVNYNLFSHHIYRLYLISAVLEYPELNEYSKSMSRLILLEYHDIDYEIYPEVLCEIAEWIYVKYFKTIYNNESIIDMDKVD